jgi:acyl-CoA-binding protein
LRESVESGQATRRDDILTAEGGARELLLQHRLFKSDKTGEVINPKFTLLSFPPRWHYDALRGLEYFARSGAGQDDRLQDAIDLLNQLRRPDGLWPLQYKYSGKVFFEMERVGQPSRWNTLRALRIVRWWASKQLD